MASLIESGRIVDLILLVLIVEAAVLVALLRLRRLQVPVSGLLLNLVAAACLVVGLRAALSGDDWRLAGAWLGAALLAHAGELTLRLRRSSGKNS